MLTIVVTLFLALEGIRAIPPEHKHPCEKLRCKPPAPMGPAENFEEFEKMCKIAIEYTECEIRYKQCLNNDSYDLAVVQRHLSTLISTCSEYHLLDADYQDTPIELEYPCEIIPCKKIPAPSSFPENNEELQRICKPAIKYFECEARNKQCSNDDPEGIKAAYRVLSTFRDVCSEDTRLHARVVDNLECVSKLIDDETKFCAIGETSSDHIKRLTETLSEKRLVSLSDYGNETSRLYECVDLFNFFACQGITVERECGYRASEAYIEIMQRATPGTITDCKDSHNAIAEIILLRKLEEGK